MTNEKAEIKNQWSLFEQEQQWMNEWINEYNSFVVGIFHSSNSRMTCFWTINTIMV